jgi:hypothetical protein
MVMRPAAYAMMWEKIQEVVTTEEYITASEHRAKGQAAPQKLCERRKILTISFAIHVTREYY